LLSERTAYVGRATPYQFMTHKHLTVQCRRSIPLDSLYESIATS
jgi:hypothetical protein